MDQVVTIENAYICRPDRGRTYHIGNRTEYELGGIDLIQPFCKKSKCQYLRIGTNQCRKNNLCSTCWNRGREMGHISRKRPREGNEQAEKILQLQRKQAHLRSQLDQAHQRTLEEAKEKVIAQAKLAVAQKGLASLQKDMEQLDRECNQQRKRAEELYNRLQKELERKKQLQIQIREFLKNMGECSA